MNPEIQTVASIATILAATIAAAISFVGLVISKENKVSEFRQEWVNNLRQEVSEYLSSIQLMTQTLLFAKDHLDFNEKKEGVFETVSAYRKTINEKYCAIRLRLNPDEQSHGELLNSINALSRLITRAKGEAWYTNDDVIASMDVVLREAQKILKFEWERVKKGEQWFFWTKYIVGGVVCFSLLLSISVYFQRMSPATHEPVSRVKAPSPPNSEVPRMPPDKAASLTSGVK